MNRCARAAIGFAALALLAAPVSALDLQGHRGARGLAPENTLPAFATALSIGVSTLELDIGVTADGVVAVAHDRRLNPDIARDSAGAYVAAPAPAIRSLSLEQLRAFDVGVARPGSRYAQQFPQQKTIPGTAIPTLKEVVDLVAKSGNATVRLNIETKLSPLAPDETVGPEAMAQALIAAIADAGIESRTIVQSFDWRTLKYVQRIAPSIATACLTIERGEGDNVQRGRTGASPWTAGLDIDEFGGSVPRLVKAAGCRIWSPYFRDVSPAAISDAKTLGLAIVVWTVNDPADIRRMIELGIDGIISDYPDRLREVAHAAGVSLPVASPVLP